MKNFNLKIFLSPLFLLGLFLLLLNDFFLKDYFHNFLTGKLSDFAGLFIFPIFFCAFFPHRRLIIYALTATIFIFWKSPFSQSLIDLWNENLFFQIDRTIDLTDLSALSVLPFSYLYFFARQFKYMPLNSIKQAAAIFVVFVSVFAFTATGSVDERYISLEREYKIKLSKSEIETVLRQNEKISNLIIKSEIETFPANQYPDVKTDPNGFHASFSLKQKICETNLPYISFHIQEKNNSSTTDFPDAVRKPESDNLTEIRGASFNFTCQNFPGNTNQPENSNNSLNQYRSELIAIFENEVIGKLKEKESQLTR